MITEEDYVCEACRDLAMHAVNQSLQQVSGSGDELAGPSNRGHTHVCLLCGCSLLHRQSNHILRENPTELQRSTIAIIESRLAPRQTGDMSDMMHMYFWFDYNLQEFMFPGLEITTRWSFALTWIVLFFVALLFEASKVYLVKVQRDAFKKLYPYRSDERRTLLCEREAGSTMEATTSRNCSNGPITRWAALKVRALVNAHQSLIFLIHNVVGYLLMLAVMIYNVHLLLAVVFGMMLGYFLFGPKLTKLQMQCFKSKRVVICTPECDDTAENTTPPLLNSSNSSESDFFICQTRTCIQPSHYFPATQDGGSNEQNATCFYGAKKCPSRVARAKKMQASTSHCHHVSEKEDSPSVEDDQLLRTERQGCCKKMQEIPPEEKCCKKSETTVVVHESVPDQSCCKEEEQKRQETRERSPQISCCHNAKTPSDSQEQIIN